MSAAIPLPILPFRGIAALKEVDQLILACPFLPSFPFGDGGLESAAYFPNRIRATRTTRLPIQPLGFPVFKLQSIAISPGEIAGRILTYKIRALRASGALRV